MARNRIRSQWVRYGNEFGDRKLLSITKITGRSEIRTTNFSEWRMFNPLDFLVPVVVPIHWITVVGHLTSVAIFRVNDVLPVYYSRTRWISENSGRKSTKTNQNNSHERHHLDGLPNPSCVIRSWFTDSLAKTGDSAVKLHESLKTHLWH